MEVETGFQASKKNALWTLKAFRQYFDWKIYKIQN
jgi:hypothetical protein